MQNHVKVLLACIASLTIVAITSLVTGYNSGVFESVKSAILIIAGYAVGRTVASKEEA